jgi:hypothetical protein
MKLFHLFAIALITAPLLASPSRAATLNLGTLSAGSSGTGTSYSGMTTSFTDTMNGTLAANSEVTFTYNYTGLTPAALSMTGIGSNSGGLAYTSVSGFNSNGTLLYGTQNQSTSSPTLPIFVTASLTPSSGTASTTIVNASSSSVNFSSIFQDIIFSISSGALTSSYKVSAVPLPASLVLFASGLLALAGFAAYRKKYAARA